MTLDQAAPAIDACASALRAGSSSFHTAALLLPRRVRRPATALYAFCRLADDEVDEAQGGDAQAAAVRRLRARLADLAAGAAPRRPVDQAFAAVARHFRIPMELPAALVEGFAWDAEGRRYEDLEALLGYAARVAASVGAMMALVMGARRPDALARACDLGLAMQLSNIARDVGEDARAGRLYLPLCWMREEGLDPEAFLATPAFTPALGRVVARLLRAADTLYARSVSGVACLPLDCRPGINAARLVYGAIGTRIAARDLDSVSARAYVPGLHKLALVARGALQLSPGRSALAAPTAPSVQFLVDAVGRLDAAEGARARATPWWQVGQRLDDRLSWTADLFTRLGRAERAGAPVRSR